MQTNRRDARTFFLASCVVIAALAGVVSAQSGVPNGTWKLNVAKSKLPSTLALKSAMVVIHPLGPATMTMVDSVGADGAALSWSYTGPYDGKDVPVSGNPAVDTAARKSVNATTTETTFKKSGKVVAVQTNVLSADGKILTVTSKGVDAQGRPADSVLVFERQ
jgi:hypothetical protein